MSAYVVPTLGGKRRRNSFLDTSLICRRRNSAVATSYPSQFLHRRSVRPYVNQVEQVSTFCSNRVETQSESTEILATGFSKQEPDDNWKEELVPGVVIEYWSQGELRFGLVESAYERGVVAKVVRLESGKTACSPDAKISFGEVISIWGSVVSPRDTNTLERLIEDVERGLQFLRLSRPRSLDLHPVYEEMRRFPKNDPRASQSSEQIGSIIFHGVKRDSREKKAAITAASAILVAADAVRFKRSGPGQGWRALPGSVVTSRRRCSFVETCKSILEHRSSGATRRPMAWSREQLEILRDLEVFAASGTAAKGTAATALGALGYESSDDGAAQLLLDIEYWATGAPADHHETIDLNRQFEEHLTASEDDDETMFSKQDRVSSEAHSKGARRDDLDVNGQRHQQTRGWTFSSEILAEAKEIYRATLKRRLNYTARNSGGQTNKRRNLFTTTTGKPLRPYCIDDKSSRFLDDALSVEVTDSGSIARVAIHVTDVDEVVKSGSPIDELARERGQSLYLPLKPLHMLPAAIMEAACFNTNMPAEAITVLIELRIDSGVICNWEVFPSILPAVKRLTYEEFSAVLEEKSSFSNLGPDDCENLKLIGRLAPILALKLDQRRPNRKLKSNGSQGTDDNIFSNVDFEPKGVAAVRLSKRSSRNTTGTVKVAQVVDFCESGGHSIVANMLVCAGSLLRQFARENRAPLPEGRGASAYVARCGTAPMRRYSDLATQRQIKCVLFGRQPAGRRRMDDLRLWLAKRQAAAERTVTERRRSALFDSLSDHCAQQTAMGGSPFAVLQGHTRGVSVNKKGCLKVEVDLDGTGLSTVAPLRGPILASIEAQRRYVDSRAETDSGQRSLAVARNLMPSGSKVKVHVRDVNTVSYTIEATVVEVLESAHRK
eukprot:GFKZ01006048.1.p1 GENE.GFKZ01006048.1~~GFKZ01006048.1.p1  ORF type:complete len:892 (+),score=90.91 GFKZ01006048.1:312-2987(+)